MSHEGNKSLAAHGGLVELFKAYFDNASTIPEEVQQEMV